MVTAQNSLRAGTDPFDVGDTLPVTLDHWSFSFNRDEIGSLLSYLVKPLDIGCLFRNRVVPLRLVARDLQHRGSRRWNHWVDVGGFVKVLELPVLGKKRRSLISLYWRVRNGYFQDSTTLASTSGGSPVCHILDL